MDVRTISDFDTFLQLKEPWNELAAQSPDDHAFMRHEWFEHWLKSQKMTASLHMITAWQGGQLSGAFPLVWRQISHKGLRFRALCFAESAISPRCNALSGGPEVVEALVSSLAAEKRCQLFELENLEADSPTTRSFVDGLRARTNLAYYVDRGRQSPYLTLACTWEEYLGGLTSRRRKWIRNSCERRLAESGKTYEIRHANQHSDADFLIESMLTVSGHSWKAEAGTSIEQVPSQRRFYTEFTPVGLARGMVEALVLTLDGTPVAFDYYLRHGRRYSEIRSAFDSAYAHIRPGENLRIAFIKHLTQSPEPAELDFGGETSEYKMQWANHVRAHVKIHAARPLSKGALVVWWKKAHARGRGPTDGAEAQTAEPT